MDIKEFFLETIQRFTQLSSTTLVGIDYSDLNALLLILAFSLLVAFLVYKVKKARKIIEIENKNQSKIIEKTESHWVLGYIQGLHVESKIDFEWYQSELGVLVENIPKSEILQRLTISNKQLFQMYHTDMQKVSYILDDALRLQIVKANSLFKNVNHMMVFNNELYDEYLRLKEYAAKTDRPIDESVAYQQRLILKKHGLKILRAHELMLPQVRQMLAMLASSRKDIVM